MLAILIITFLIFKTTNNKKFIKLLSRKADTNISFHCKNLDWQENAIKYVSKKFPLSLINQIIIHGEQKDNINFNIQTLTGLKSVSLMCGMPLKYMQLIDRPFACQTLNDEIVFNNNPIVICGYDQSENEAYQKSQKKCAEEFNKNIMKNE